MSQFVFCVELSWYDNGRFHHSISQWYRNQCDVFTKIAEFSKKYRIIDIKLHDDLMSNHMKKVVNAL